MKIKNARHCPAKYILFVKFAHPIGRHPIKKAKSHDLAFFLVDPKGFEPSTSRMRTERSPEADILHPYNEETFEKHTIFIKYQNNFVPNDI